MSGLVLEFNHIKKLQTMKTLFAFLFILFSVGSVYSQVDHDSLTIIKNISFYHNEPYTGQTFKKFTDGEKVIAEWEGGLLHGNWEKYHSNGQIKWKGYYNHGKTNGRWEEYTRDGQLKSTVLYKDGIIQHASEK
jgi:antitoxin component YwqK of YwqJK toxin-antitoxin module